MQAGCIIVLGLLLVAAIFLFMFANPVGWVLAALFGVAAVIVTLARVDWKRAGFRSPRVEKHGPEDRERGPNDDAMMK